MDNIVWWAYRHTNGTLQVKRYFDKRDIEEAHESPFVSQVSRNLVDGTREEALAIFEDIL